MTEINLYKTSDINKVLPRLIETIVAQGKKIYLYCSSSKEEEEVDYLLWSYSQLSFIPHGTTNDPYEDEQKVLVGQNINYKTKAEILICLGEINNLEEAINKYEKILLFNQSLSNIPNYVIVNVVEQDQSGKWIKRKYEDNCNSR